MNVYFPCIFSLAEVAHLGWALLGQFLKLGLTGVTLFHLWVPTKGAVLLVVMTIQAQEGKWKYLKPFKAYTQN